MDKKIEVILQIYWL